MNIISHMDKNAFDNLLPSKTRHRKSVPNLKKNSLEGKRNIFKEG